MTIKAPPVPGFGSSTAAIVRLSAMRTLRGRKFRVAAVATFVVVLFPAVVALVSDDAEPVAIVTGALDWGFFRMLVFLLPLLFTAGAVAEESQARTLHFLAMRPLPRASIALGKYIVGTGSALVILWAGILLLHVIGYATSPSEMIEQIGATARAGGAASFLLALYCAIALFWGTLAPEAGGMLTIMWLGFVEWFGMLLPGIFRFMSMSHFARELGGLERAGLDSLDAGGGASISLVADVDLEWCALTIGVELFFFLGLALLIMQTAQLRFGKA